MFECLNVGMFEGLNDWMIDCWLFSDENYSYSFQQIIILHDFSLNTVI